MEKEPIGFQSWNPYDACACVEGFDGENGEEAYKEAKQNVKGITAFIKKWDK